MTLPRTRAVPGMIAAYGAFGELIEPLSAAEWAAPTRCDGWTAGDVAAHVIGQLTDVVNFRLDGIGSPEVTERQVTERRGRAPSELAEELRASTKTASGLIASFDDAAWEGPAPGGLGGTLGFGVEALWYDAYLHADDIRAALGRPSVHDDGLRASVSHVAQVLTGNGWRPATLALDGIPEFEVSGGGGKPITGDPLAFVLAATGRADPAPLGLDETVNIYRQ
jgi:uncharacterized protein (TIGR03083 family)